jgi:hypothetical protein
VTVEKTGSEGVARAEDIVDLDREPGRVNLCTTAILFSEMDPHDFCPDLLASSAPSKVALRLGSLLRLVPAN